MIDDRTPSPRFRFDVPAAPAVAVVARIGWPSGRPTLDDAERLGRLLAEAGFLVVSAGYGELSGAVARGAAVAGGRVLGLPVRTWPMEPSPWLTEIRWMPDSYAQCAVLGACPALVAVGPGPGSLAEAAFAWQIAGRRAELILLGREWRHWLSALWRWLVPRQSALGEITVVDDPADVVPRLERRRGPAGDDERPRRRPPDAPPRGHLLAGW